MTDKMLKNSIYGQTVIPPTLYTFTVYYKFNDDTRVNAVDHTIISTEDYEQAAQECMHYYEDMLDEFDAVPVGLVLKGSVPFAD